MWEGIAVVPRQRKTTSFSEWRGDVARFDSESERTTSIGNGFLRLRRKGRGHPMGIAIAP